MCVHMYVCVCEEIYYKGLAHIIIQVGKPQDLQGKSAHWRSRRANGAVAACLAPHPGEQMA